jgi:predicted porin
MKKSLVAIATLTSALAFAQSSVTLYGIADAYVGAAKTTTITNTGVSSGVSQNVLNSGGLSGSRWGLRGSEDLGGGLRANFQAESGFNIDSGGSAQGGLLFGRQAWVGLSGGFGAITLGRQYSAYDDLRSGTDTLDHTSFSSTVDRGAWDNVGLAYAGRINNSIRYTTPNYGGFTAALQYGLGENKTATSSAGSNLSLKLVYANGPVTVGFAHQQDKGPGVALNTVTGVVTGVNGESFVGGATKNTFNLLSGSFDFGVAKLFAGVNTSKDNATVSNKDTEWHIGASAPLGPVTVSADYARSKHKDVEKGNSFGVQATYALSKRTNAYVGGVTSKDESLIPGNLSGEKRRLFGLGVRHIF